MDSRLIQHAIYEANIDRGAALEGGCGPIARAIQDVFGGQYAVVEDDGGLPRHAAVCIQGQLYDGTGKTTLSSLCSMFADHPMDAHEDETVNDCQNIRLTDSLPGFRRDRDLTRNVRKRLQATLD